MRFNLRSMENYSDDILLGSNNRFDIINPLARFLQEQQCKKRQALRVGFAGQANVSSMEVQ